MSSRKTLTTHFLKQHDFSVSQISLYQIETLQVFTAITYNHIHFLSHAESIYVWNRIQQYALRVFSH